MVLSFSVYSLQFQISMIVCCKKVFDFDRSITLLNECRRRGGTDFGLHGGIAFMKIPPEAKKFDDICIVRITYI